MKGKLVEWGARYFLGGFFREVAEGKRGAFLQTLYLKARGKKTATGFVLGTVLAGVLYFDPELGAKLAPYIASGGGLLVYIGLLDKQWNVEPKPGTAPVEFRDAMHSLMSAGPALAALTVLVLEVLHRLPSCSRCDEWAHGVETAVAAVGASTGWLAARFAEPPDLMKVPGEG